MARAQKGQKRFQRPGGKRVAAAAFLLVAPAPRSAAARFRKDREDRLLDMEPVLGLVEDDRARIVEDGLLDLLAGWAGRQCMKRASGLAAAKRPPSPRRGACARPGGLALLLLAHAGPDIRVDDVGALHGLAGSIVKQSRPPTLGPQLGADLLLGSSPAGPASEHPHPEEAGAEDPGIGHVEARVAEEGDLAAPRGRPRGRRSGPAHRSAAVKASA